ncbi:hypothetical protein ACV334_33905, partial [Pseudomonas aeruginosa]
MQVAKKPNTWGTYSLRMIQRTDPNGKATFIPLDRIVERLLLAHQGRTFQAADERGVHDILEYFDPAREGYGFELPIYVPSRDAKPKRIPCLSHLSFNLTCGKLELTAVY